MSCVALLATRWCGVLEASSTCIALTIARSGSEVLTSLARSRLDASVSSSDNSTANLLVVVGTEARTCSITARHGQEVSKGCAVWCLSWCKSSALVAPSLLPNSTAIESELEFSFWRFTRLFSGTLRANVIRSW